MLNKKLQTGQRNEMRYQLLKLMTKQRKNPSLMHSQDKTSVVSNMPISAAYTKVNAVGMKVTTAERLQLLEEFLLSEG
ncbi:hypothetical protein Tco_0696481 [Tanacetum coccineum]